LTSTAISEDSGADLTQAPKVSVVIPLYNKQDSVRRCIESALNQSWKELEVIVVDDGSTDNSNVAAEPMLTEGRVRIIRTPNRGACAARNLGVSQARGAYVAFLDADDLFQFDHIENALRLISDNVNIAHFSAAIFDRDGVRHIKARRGLREGEQMSDYYVLAHGIVDPSTLVVDINTALNIKWNEKIGYLDDFDYSLRLFEAGVRFVYDPKPHAIKFQEFDANRLSSSGSSDKIKEWVEENKKLLTKRSYVGFYGSQVAIHERNKFRALLYFMTAAASGCFGPDVAFRCLLQILLSRRTYVRMILVSLRTLETIRRLRMFENKIEIIKDRLK
jgi:glycosyltransferase involved in cell wall biosynthesis